MLTTLLLHWLISATVVSYLFADCKPCDFNIDLNLDRLHPVLDSIIRSSRNTVTVISSSMRVEGVMAAFDQYFHATFVVAGTRSAFGYLNVKYETDQ